MDSPQETTGEVIADPITAENVSGGGEAADSAVIENVTAEVEQYPSAPSVEVILPGTAEFRLSRLEHILVGLVDRMGGSLNSCISRQEADEIKAQILG